MITAMSLGTYKRLEKDDANRAKRMLLSQIGNYYRRYHDKDGDRHMLAKIEEAARQSPEIAAEIAKKTEVSR